MARILNSDILCNFQRVVETRDYFYLNGHAYTKDNFQPVPLAMNAFNGSNSSFVVKNTIPITTSAPETWPIADSFIVDDYNKNINYAFVSNAVTANTNYMQIIKYMDEQIIYRNGLTDIRNMYSYLGQDDRNIYISIQGGGTTNYNGIVVKIDKENLVATTIKDYGANFNIMKIIEKNNLIYVSVANINGQVNIERLNKVSQSMETISTATVSWGGRINLVLTDFCPIEEDKFYFYAVTNNDTKPFIKFIFDLNEPIVSLIAIRETANVEWSGDIKSNMDIFPLAQFNTYQTFITKSGSNYLLNVVAYQQATAANTTTAQKQGFYTFLIQSNGDLVLKSFYRMDEAITKGVLYTKDRRYVIIPTNKGVHCFVFNDGGLNFVNTYHIPDVMKAVGIDGNDRIWFLNADNTVDMIYQNIPIDFQYEIVDYYTWTGADILTNMKISIRDQQNRFISVPLQLTIVGPAVFSQNESNLLLINTSSNEATIIPIKIIGEGQISIYPETVIAL